MNPAAIPIRKSALPAQDPTWPFVDYVEATEATVATESQTSKLPEESRDKPMDQASRPRTVRGPARRSGGPALTQGHERRSPYGHGVSSLLGLGGGLFALP